MSLSVCGKPGKDRYYPRDGPASTTAARGGSVYELADRTGAVLGAGNDPHPPREDGPRNESKHGQGCQSMAAASDHSSTSDAQEIHKLVTSAQEQGTPDRYPGKRHWTRFSAGMRLEIATDPGIPSSSSHVIMQNVSEGGFAFWSKRELREHTPLFVREFSRDGDGEWMAAHVRHCTVGIRGYLVGAEFENPPEGKENPPQET